ncbi:MAG: apolipoprotein N-acyltransferase [Bdellovibrionota bacterium]
MSLKTNRLSIFLILFSALMVSSAFFTLSYPKISFGIMMPFSLVPLFIGVRKIALQNCTQSIFSICKKSILLFWFFGIVLQLISFFWITKPIIYFGAVPTPLAYILFVFISILSAFFFPLLFSPFIFSLCYEHKFSGKKIFILAIALAITFMEIILPRFFDWSFGGLLSSSVVFSQLESLFGFNTGSLFIFVTSLTLASLSRNNIRPLLTCSAVFLLVISFGAWRVSTLNKIFASGPKFRVAFVQPNFTFNSLANLPLPSVNSQRQSFSRMLEMSKNTIQKAAAFDGKKPDLLVWPESTAPDFFLSTPWQINAVTKFSQQTGVPFLIQATEIKPDDLKKIRFENIPIWSSSVIVNSSGLVPQFFQKWIPMPFGEEFPLENKLPILGTWYRAFFKNASKMERGSSYNSLPIQKNKVFVTPLICFDSIDQELSYLSAKKGQASFFVNQANFVWMVDSNAGLELSLLDQMRAIENGKSVVVASNTGPSLAFDPLGQLIFPPTTLLTQEFNFVDIPLYTGKTLFQTVYKWPLVILGILSICYFIYITRKSYIYEKQLNTK